MTGPKKADPKKTGPQKTDPKKTVTKTTKTAAPKKAAGKKAAATKPKANSGKARKTSTAVSPSAPLDRPVTDEHSRPLLSLSSPRFWERPSLAVSPRLLPRSPQQPGLLPRSGPPRNRGFDVLLSFSLG